MLMTEFSVKRDLVINILTGFTIMVNLNRHVINPPIKAVP
jgi:hypothetical protein